MPKSLRALLSMNDPGWGRNQNSGDSGGDHRPPDQRPGGQNDGPPDLDELWRDMNRRLNNLFGRGGGGDGGPGLPTGPGGEGPTMRGALIGLGILALVALLLWLASGLYIIREGESSIELRFGEFIRQKDRAGLTMRMPYPFETHELVNTQQLRTVEVGYRNGVRNKNLRESLMLTSNESIVDIQYSMQYRVSDPKAFLFNNRMGNNTGEIVRQAGEAAMREIVGKTGIDQVLFEEKVLVAQRANKLVQEILDRYGAGIALVDVTIQQVQPPDQVQEAFEDANKAAQDRERLINEGQAYANDVIPRARGSAARLMQEADGYRASVLAGAEGDAKRFDQLLAEYTKAPKVTRDRLYLETMQEVLGNTSKLYMDSNSANSMLYMPLDKILEKKNSNSSAASNAQAVRDALDEVLSNRSQSSRSDSTPIDPRDRNAMRDRLRPGFR